MLIKLRNIFYLFIIKEHFKEYTFCRIVGGRKFFILAHPLGQVPQQVSHHNIEYFIFHYLSRVVVCAQETEFSLYFFLFSS